MRNREREEAIRILYLVDGKSYREIGRILEIDSSVVRKIAKRVGVKSRTISEAKKGTAPKPQTILASVRARRKHVLEGMPEVGYKIRPGGYLALYSKGAKYTLAHRVAANAVGTNMVVHHVDGDTSNNDPTNLMTVTISEHMRIHSETRGRGSDGRFL
jgi:hypothetical protein